MTGGGDLDETVHDELAEALDETADETAPVEVDDVDEIGGSAEGEADPPVSYDVGVSENDPDPTAGASDVGGLAGGIDDPGEGSTRR